jgi:hypothetical protein
MDAVMTKDTFYGSVEFNPKGKKMYKHRTTLSDGSSLEIISSEPTFHTFAVENFKHEGEALLARRKVRERYLAKKAKQASE